MDKKFLLRNEKGDQPIAAEAEIADWLRNGQCKPSDFLYDFEAKKWWRAGEYPAAAALFAEKPVGAPERRVIYYLAPGGKAGAPLGPCSTKEIQGLAKVGEICANTWVFVEGDKEWRQVKNVKILNDMLPAVPGDTPAEPPAPMETLSAPPFALTAAPAPPAAAPSGPPPSISLDSVALPDAEPEREAPSMPSITLDLGTAAPGLDVPPPKPPAPATAPPAIAPVPAAAADPDAAPSLSLSGDEDPHVEREEVTMALDTMGLKLHSENFNAPPPPAKPAAAAPARPSIAPLPSVPGVAPGGPPKAPPSAVPVPPPAAHHLNTGAGGKDDAFDGIVAEIPTDPIWLVKQANGEVVSGPFRFLEVMKFLEEGKLTKNDKIARTGSKAFTKISQQYEFNVKYSIENVIEGGQEKQKILIRRRHPRVPYITGVQVVSKHGLMAGQCVNISAGGILMEIAKAEFNLGDIIEVKILPGLINKSISCKSLIIGKIPKAPPGYALKFEDLKPEDKEAIEHYVQETLKREMSKKN